MNRAEARDAISVMESGDMRPILERIAFKRNKAINDLISGTGNDDENRGVVKALRWVLDIPNHILKDIEDDVKMKGVDSPAPSDDD